MRPLSLSSTGGGTFPCPGLVGGGLSGLPVPTLTGTCTSGVSRVMSGTVSVEVGVLPDRFSIARARSLGVR